MYCFMTEKDTKNLMMHNLTNFSEASDLSQRNLPSTSLPMPLKVELAANNKVILDASILQQLHLRLSQSSQKQFIFFDQCGGTNRIYLHPSLLKDLSGDTDVSDPSVAEGCNAFQPLKEMLSFKQLNINGGSAETSIAYKWTVPSSFAAVYGNQNSWHNLTLLEGLQSRLHASVPEINSDVCSSAADDGKFFNADVSSSLFNDIDDLEALLSSDDEVSTGHTPAKNNAWEGEVDSHAHKQEKPTEGDFAIQDTQETEKDMQDVDRDSTISSFIAKESKENCAWIEHVGACHLSNPIASTSNNLLQLSETAIVPNRSHGTMLLADGPCSSSEFSSSSSLLKRNNTAASLPLLTGSAKLSRNNQIRQTVR